MLRGSPGLCLLLALGLLLRLGWGLTRPADDAALASFPDQLEYLQLGRSLLRGEGLVLVDPRFSGPMYAFRTPGYPLWVALCGGQVSVIRVTQSLLDLLTVVSVYVLARQWAPRAALVAVAAVVFNPLLIYHTSLILTETLFAAMLSCGLMLMLLRPTSRRVWYGEWKWVLGCSLLALSVMVRPGAAAMPVILAAASAFVRPQSLRVPPVACAVLLTLAVLLPWGFRNQHVLGTWVWTTTNAGITAYDGWNPDATGGSDQAGFVARMPHLALLSETQRNAYLLELARQFREDHPGRIPKLVVAKLLRTWSPAPPAAADRPWVQRAAGWGYAGLVWPLALLGLLAPLKPRSNEPIVSSVGLASAVAARPPADHSRSASSDGWTGWRVKLLLLVPPIYFTAAAVWAVGSLRYRLPAEPMIALLAAMGAAALKEGSLRRWVVTRSARVAETRADST